VKKRRNGREEKKVLRAFLAELSSPPSDLLNHSHISWVTLALEEGYTFLWTEKSRPLPSLLVTAVIVVFTSGSSMITSGTSGRASEEQQPMVTKIKQQG